MPGGQGVAGSNPVHPTRIIAGQRGCSSGLLFYLLYASGREWAVQTVWFCTLGILSPALPFIHARIRRLLSCTLDAVAL